MRYSLLLCLFLSGLSLSLTAHSKTKEPMDADFALELTRYLEPEGKESCFIYCPPDAKKGTLCKVSREENGIEVLTADVAYKDTYDAIDKFLKALPPADVVAHEASEPLYQIGNTSFIWRVRAGKRWSVGSLTHSETVHPGVIATKRMKAIGSIEWKVESWFHEALAKKAPAVHAPQKK